MGNGLTNPEIQYKAYTDYALDMGLVKRSEYDRINKMLPACEQAIKNCGNLLIPILLHWYKNHTALQGRFQGK